MTPRSGNVRSTRAELRRSVPFWVLLVGSLGLTGFGAWLVFDRLGALSDGIRSQTTDTAAQLEVTVAAYVAPPTATVGGVILGAGLVGLLLALALATLSALLPRPAVEVVEAIDWTSDDADGFDDEQDDLSADDGSSDREPVSDGAAPEEAVSEDPDVETPSEAPAPARAGQDSSAEPR